MSNTPQGGMTREQKKELIVAALDELTPDVLELIYRITLHAESGLE